MHFAGGGEIKDCSQDARVALWEINQTVSAFQPTAKSANLSAPALDHDWGGNEEEEK